MELHAVELRLVELELVVPLATASGAHTSRPVVIVRLLTDVGDGEGECSALAAPGYTAEWSRGAFGVLGDHLVPALLDEPVLESATSGLERLEPIRGNEMAKAALEMALLDVELRAAQRSLAEFLGATRTSVAAGATVGIGAPAEVTAAVGRAVRAGYERVKVKISPGNGAAALAEVRAAYPDLSLCADANGSFDLERDHTELELLAGLDLLTVEQPLAPGALAEHAELVKLGVPIVLDESVRSLAELEAVLVATAAIGVSVKPACCGGLVAGRALAQAAAGAGLSVTLGGMLETGLGRAAALALAGRPEFDLPSDLGASDRYFAPDLTEEHVLESGMLAVPSGPGLGVRCDRARLAAATIAYRRISVARG